MLLDIQNRNNERVESSYKIEVFFSNIILIGESIRHAVYLLKKYTEVIQR